MNATTVNPLRIGIVIYPGFDELDAVAPYEVLRKAVQAGAPGEVRLVALEKGPTSGSQGMTVIATDALGPTTSGTAPLFDWLIVAGGSWAARSPIGAWGEIARGDLPRALAAHAARGTALGSVCTGAMLLSAAGLLRGRPAVTHHVALTALAAEGAQLVEARVVDDGDRITAGGVTSGLDLALWFAERFWGKALAAKLADAMEYTRVGPVWQRAGGRATL